MKLILSLIGYIILFVINLAAMIFYFPVVLVSVHGKYKKSARVEGSIRNTETNEPVENIPLGLIPFLLLFSLQMNFIYIFRQKQSILVVIPEEKAKAAPSNLLYCCHWIWEQYLSESGQLDTK